MRLFRRSKKKTAGVVVEIFSKPGCHLCEQAKHTLEKMQRKYGFELREINIEKDPALMLEYETRIPLIWVDSHLVCKYVVDENIVAKNILSARAFKNSSAK
jgi:glutaredoxin